jgi:4-amino-4-deoxy-L-arabinose transferase-like glycosyltransferase
MGAMDHHGGGIWYYVPAVLIGFFPWSIFGIPVVNNLLRDCRKHDRSATGSRFLAGWIVVYMAFFSLAATKLPSYILPTYPALALATGCFIDRWLTLPGSVHRWWPRLSFGSLLVIGALAAVALPAMAHVSFHGRSILERIGISTNLVDDVALAGWLGVILALGGAICLILAERARRYAAITVLACTAMAFGVTLLADMAVRLDRHQSSPIVAEKIRDNSSGAIQVGQYGYLPPSLVYYMDQRIAACNTPQRAVRFLQDSMNSFVVTTDEKYAELQALLPADVVVIDQCARFPRRGSVMILGRKAFIAQRSDGQAE